MNRLTNLALFGATAVLVLVATACALTSEAATIDEGASESQTIAASAPDVGPGIGVNAAPATYGYFGWNTPRQEPAIWVTGRAKVAVAPDLALLDLGVEVTLPTVAEARNEAAQAMDAVMAALTAAGVKDSDIQTRHFDIRPRYDWREVEEDGVRSSQEVLIGYRVTNRLSVKVRDMDSVSQVIDEVITAGGDAIRFRDLQFTVEDTSPLMTQLREEAVGDGMKKAGHYAELSGLTLGEVAYVSEPGVSMFGARSVFQESAQFALAAAYDQTSVSGGELQVSLTVEMAFEAD